MPDKAYPGVACSTTLDIIHNPKLFPAPDSVTFENIEAKFWSTTDGCVPDRVTKETGEHYDPSVRHNPKGMPLFGAKKSVPMGENKLKSEETFQNLFVPKDLDPKIKTCIVSRHYELRSTPRSACGGDAISCY